MRIALDPQLAKTTGQRVDQQQTADQRLAESGQQRAPPAPAGCRPCPPADRPRPPRCRSARPRCHARTGSDSRGWFPAADRTRRAVLETNRRTADQGPSGLTRAALTASRMAKLSVQSSTRSTGDHCIQRVGIQPAAIRIRRTCGFNASSRAMAESTLCSPSERLSCAIWRCRLVRSSVSKSARCSSPTPAAARYSATGEQARRGRRSAPGSA